MLNKACSIPIKGVRNSRINDKDVEIRAGMNRRPWIKADCSQANNAFFLSGEGAFLPFFPKWPLFLN